MTDEGQRQLKVLDFSVEWYNLEHTPLIQLHFLTNRSPPLISQPVPKCRLTKAQEAGIKSVVFDRGGFIYQGKIQALADAAREAGLEF